MSAAEIIADEMAQIFADLEAQLDRHPAITPAALLAAAELVGSGRAVCYAGLHGVLYVCPRPPTSAPIEGSRKKSPKEITKVCGDNGASD